VRDSTEFGAPTGETVSIKRTGTAMNKIGQVLDGIVCEIAAVLWLVRVAGDR
jgi:hypothetical protein